MKQLIWIIVLFAIAIGLALAATTYSGNVYIVIEQTMLRVNLHLFVLGLIGAVVALYIVVKLFAGVLSTPDKLSRFGIGRRSRKATQALNAAGLAFFEGKFQEAETQAAKVLANKEAGGNRVLALMLAAHAADQSGNQKTRDQYLHDIAKLPSKAQLSRYLLLAESALNQHQYEIADEHLKAAAQINPRLTRLVRLQLRWALDKGDALEVLDKVDKLRRAGAMNDTEAEHLSQRAYEQLLNLVSDNRGMKACLKRIPEHLKSGEMSATIAQKYVQLGLYSQAIAWVNQHYPAQHNADLLPAFVQSSQYLDEHGQQKAIDTADAWLRSNPNDARLLRHLGELAATRQLWGKARGYLEASLAIEHSVPAHLTLAKVLEQSGQASLAQEQRQLALSQIEQAQ
ncbi:putative protoheme IX biogenesis protein [Kingella kingae]|uniref:HemY protein n=3 Tax=Kingella kingae TaxID=504 RepID=F5S6H8_KINKI|nr:heme biosynthesis HemY N-terminal domain-containing protein [Kingella kingae]EGK10007.1 HemY protein [Kingella kingae ATCC 23330]QIP47745.1 heme biosynthesis protein HemY [Kingella kingae]UOP02403.1 heme biosynthesis protein HemY [Kingella kingae]SQH25565.1 putative protoheme IX biogenesis protein [Kingella kingae]STR03532.1 putative protoheme IX biogenesis protein [Kingella kingae]